MTAAARKKECDKVKNRTCGSLHITKENKKENKPKRNIRAVSKAGAVTRSLAAAVKRHRFSCYKETVKHLL
jgi:hypothetical protein